MFSNNVPSPIDIGRYNTEVIFGRVLFFNTEILAEKKSTN